MLCRVPMSYLGRKNIFDWQKPVLSGYGMAPDKVGDTGSYDEEDGGMFWQWQPIRNPNPNKPGDGKMACINFPHCSSRPDSL